MKGKCRFCDITDGNFSGEENRPIWESTNYISLASIGALVEGWILIVPKRHILSMKELYAERNFIDFANSMLTAMKLQYSGPFIAFEHGPNKCSSNTSCGTDHAHLHLMPYKNSLYPDMLDSGLIWKRCTADRIPSIAGANEYLFYTEIPANSNWEYPKGFLHILEQPTSQYFRKLIAKQQNCFEEYDYKKYARINIAIETNTVLSKAIAC
jgi:diadenosine tetraphosphate (Ap4A) HIT family hydrolase